MDDFPESQIWDLINDAWDRMTPQQRRLWDMIRVMPTLWQLEGQGSAWVVAIVGSTVLYFNHLEDGFNHSGWRHYGTIDKYQAMQWRLEETVQHQLDVLRSGYDPGPWSGPPIPGTFQP